MCMGKTVQKRKMSGAVLLHSKAWVVTWCQLAQRALAGQWQFCQQCRMIDTIAWYIEVNDELLQANEHRNKIAEGDLIQYVGKKGETWKPPSSPSTNLLRSAFSRVEHFSCLVACPMQGNIVSENEEEWIAWGDIRHVRFQRQGLFGKFSWFGCPHRMIVRLLPFTCICTCPVCFKAIAFLLKACIYRLWLPGPQQISGTMNENVEWLAIRQDLKKRK